MKHSFLRLQPIPIVVLLGLLALVWACTPSAPDRQMAPTRGADSSKMVVYQLMTRLFGNTQTTNIPWGTQEQNGVGKFNDITEVALASIRELGVTHVWYTGVLEHAVIQDYTAYGIPLDDADVVKGRAGSPYAIKDYYDVNPDLAVSVPDRLQEFQALIARTHAAGMKVIIDFVPNHVARSYQSDVRPAGVKDFGQEDDTSQTFLPSNNFYYLPGEPFRVPESYQPLGPHSFPTKDGQFAENPAKVTGNDVFSSSPSVHDWFETVKLNYGVDIQNARKAHFDPIPDTWLKMRDILVYWTRKGVDGFRCDMAEMVPVAFWAWVIPEVQKENPEVIFIAEIYNPQAYHAYIHKGKFDFLYDKVQLYDTLRNVLQHRGTTAHIGGIQKSLEGINHRMLHFMENHDEQRIASRFFAGDAWAGVPAMVVSATIDAGPVMIYFGQEVGEPALGESGFSGDDGRTTLFDYWGVPEHQKWVNEGAFDGGALSEEQRQLRKTYSTLLNAVHRLPAISTGAYLDLYPYLEGAPAKGYAYFRWVDEELLLIMVNFHAEAPLKLHLQIPEEVWQQVGLQAQDGWVLTDQLFTDEVQEIHPLEKFQVEVPPFGAYIWRVEAQ
jgi:glycosidase